MARVLVSVLVLVLAAVAAQAYTVNGDKGAGRLDARLHANEDETLDHYYAAAPSGDEHQYGEQQHENSEQQGKPSLLAELGDGLDTATDWLKKKATVIGHDVSDFVDKDKALLKDVGEQAGHYLKGAGKDLVHGNLGDAVDKVGRLVNKVTHKASKVLTKQVNKLVHDVTKKEEPKRQEQYSTWNQDHY